MTVVVAVIVGFLTGRMLWIAMRKSWNRPELLRKNYQGLTVPTAGGIILSLSLLVVEGVRALVATTGIGPAPGLTPVRASALVAVLSFTILGLVDDLVGTSGSRGFSGHMKAFSRGELTSGMVKLIGGSTTAVIAASLLDHRGTSALLLNAAIIALSANFFNLLDLRPGRSTKMGIAIMVLLAVASKLSVALVPGAIVLGAAVALAQDELRERVMLGDTGANALGAGIGLGLVSQVGGTGRWVLFAVMLLLNLLSEIVSYTKIIQNVAPLRFLDNIGRRRPPVVDLRDVEGEPYYSPRMGQPGVSGGSVAGSSFSYPQQPDERYSREEALNGDFDLLDDDEDADDEGQSFADVPGAPGIDHSPEADRYDKRNGYFDEDRY